MCKDRCCWTSLEEEIIKLQLNYLVFFLRVSHLHDIFAFLIKPVQWKNSPTMTPADSSVIAELCNLQQSVSRPPSAGSQPVKVGHGGRQQSAIKSLKKKRVQISERCDLLMWTQWESTLCEWCQRSRCCSDEHEPDSGADDEILKIFELLFK